MTIAAECNSFHDHILKQLQLGRKKKLSLLEQSLALYGYLCASSEGPVNYTYWIYLHICRTELYERLKSWDL